MEYIVLLLRNRGYQAVNDPAEQYAKPAAGLVKDRLFLYRIS